MQPDWQLPWVRSQYFLIWSILTWQIFIFIFLTTFLLNCFPIYYLVFLVILTEEGFKMIDNGNDNKLNLI